MEALISFDFVEMKENIKIVKGSGSKVDPYVLGI